MTPLEWRPDSSAVTLEDNERGHQVYRVISIDAASGVARSVVSEKSTTFFCCRNACRLQGKVLLVVGEVDQNVDPASTYQVVNQLTKRNKDFELLVIPGAGHGPGGADGEHKRFDFFTRHLLGVTPPDWKMLEDLTRKSTSSPSM